MTIDFGTIIRTRREELGIDQADLAGRVGMSRQNICRIEHSGNRMKLPTLLAILDELYLKIDVVEDRPG